MKIKIKRPSRSFFSDLLVFVAMGITFATTYKINVYASFYLLALMMVLLSYLIAKGAK